MPVPLGILIGVVKVLFFSRLNSGIFHMILHKIGRFSKVLSRSSNNCSKRQYPIKTKSRRDKVVKRPSPCGPGINRPARTGFIVFKVNRKRKGAGSKRKGRIAQDYGPEGIKDALNVFSY